MPPVQEKFKDTINVPIAIPAWSLVTLIGVGVFTAGTIYNQLNTVIENSKRSDDKIAVIREKQIGGLAAIDTLREQAQNHEIRISNVERAIYNGAVKK